MLQVASATALWYHSGMPLIALRWVLIRDPLGQFETQALLCTDVYATPAFILDGFVQRWIKLLLIGFDALHTEAFELAQELAPDHLDPLEQRVL